MANELIWGRTETRRGGGRESIKMFHISCITFIHSGPHKKSLRFFEVLEDYYALLSLKLYKTLGGHHGFEPTTS